MEWWNKLKSIPMKDARSEPEKISTKALVLSGFSFASLAFLYANRPFEPSILVFSLLTSTILFLVATEIADSLRHLAGVFLADLLYHFSAVLLFMGFLLFAALELGVPALIPILAAPIVFYGVLIYLSSWAVWQRLKNGASH